MAAWKQTGILKHFHHGVDDDIEIPYAFWEECRENDGVVLEHPTVIVHGVHDDIVPIENSVAAARRSPGFNQLFSVNDGHRLHESAQAMKDALQHLLAL